MPFNEMGVKPLWYINAILAVKELSCEIQTRHAGRLTHGISARARFHDLGLDARGNSGSAKAKLQC